jgi:hypothetical protein
MRENPSLLFVSFRVLRGSIKPERFFPLRLQMKINPAAVRKNFHRDSGNPQCNLPQAGAHRFRQISLAAKERRDRKEVFYFAFFEFFRGKFPACRKIYRNWRLPDWFCKFPDDRSQRPGEHRHSRDGHCKSPGGCCHSSGGRCQSPDDH